MSRIALALIAVLALGWSAASLAKAEPDVAQELKKLTGVWEGFAVENEGERPDRGPVHLRLMIDGDKISAIDLGSPEKDKSMGSGSYKLDLSKELKEFDATGVVLPGKREKTYLGIYQLEGDTLKWCIDNRAKERPTAFRTIGGKYLLILKRQK